MIKIILLFAIVSCSSIRSHEAKESHDNHSPQFEGMGQLR